MADNKVEIAETVKDYVLREFLPGEDPEMLTYSTELIKGAILDSIATIKLVTFLEERYAVEFQPHEMSVDYLNTLSDISDIVEGKISQKG